MHQHTTIPAAVDVVVVGSGAAGMTAAITAARHGLSVAVYGDPRQRPNPNLGALDTGPFYAARLVPGDLGTKGGVRTDCSGRVLRADDTVIAGLFAAGNTATPVMGHTYAGPGATIGPAMVFGYLAARQLADETPR